MEGNLCFPATAADSIYNIHHYFPRIIATGFLPCAIR